MTEKELPSSKPVSWRDVITDMGERFTSGNTIPVERATIRREEWEAILQLLHNVLANATEAGTLLQHLRTTHAFPRCCAESFESKVDAWLKAQEQTGEVTPVSREVSSLEIHADRLFDALRMAIPGATHDQLLALVKALDAFTSAKALEVMSL